MSAPERKARPFIFVLAGVNGAGKSAIGGTLLAEQGLSWFNPDTYARDLVSKLDRDANQANIEAWQFGWSRLRAAIDNGENFAIETTLGGNTMTGLFIEAAQTHDVIMIYCGLASADLHIHRVAIRVAHGGHDIPEIKIRERWLSSRLNLIKLLPFLTALQVFDNSAEAGPNESIPDPVLVLDMRDRKVLFPDPGRLEAVLEVPEWAAPIVQAAWDLYT